MNDIQVFQTINEEQVPEECQLKFSKWVLEILIGRRESSDITLKPSVITVYVC